MSPEVTSLETTTSLAFGRPVLVMSPEMLSDVVRWKLRSEVRTFQCRRLFET